MRRVRSQFLQSAFGLALALLLASASQSVAAPVPGDPCPNGDIRAQQGMAQLPGCMALEMVSPAGKFGQPARVFTPSLEGGLRQTFSGGISVSEDRVLFLALTALGDTPGFVRVSGDPYVASRDGGAEAWSTAATIPSGERFYGVQAMARPLAFGRDYASWFQIAATKADYDEGRLQVLRGSVGGASEDVTPLLSSLGIVGQNPDRIPERALSRGASGNLARFYFSPGDSLEANPNNVLVDPTFYLPGDPRPAGEVGVTTFGNTYVARRGSAAPGIELLARDADGRAWGGNCGATVAGSDSLANGSSRGAVSYDGSRVYFVTRPGQAFDSELGVGPACDKVLNKVRILVREETLGGPEIEELFGSECDRVADLPAVPACGTAGPAGSPLPDSDDEYLGGSVDGSRVYLVTSRQLTDSDVNGLDQFGSAGTCSGSFVGGCDLYLYDQNRPDGEQLVQVTAGGLGRAKPQVAQVSGDGSHVYFSSTEVLTANSGPDGGTGGTAQAGEQNLYVFDADEGMLSFVGTGSINESWPVPVFGPDLSDPEVGGSGHTLVFSSSESFTADDLDGGKRDVFRYDSLSDRIDRVSKAAAGGTDNEPHNVKTATGMGFGAGSGFNDPADPDIGIRGRWVSDDGEAIAFKTAEQLVASDENGLVDSYLWRDGEPTLIPGTTDESANLEVTAQDGSLDDRPLVSVSGRMVAFQTFEPLLPQKDGDTAIDVYAMRVDGGFPTPPAPAEECDARAGGCQGPGADSVTGDARTSSAQDGGNATQPERKLLAVGGLSAKARKTAARRGVLTLRVRSNRAGTIRLVAQGRVDGRVWQTASATGRLAGPGVTTIKLRLDRAAKRALRQGRRLDLSIAVRSTGARPRVVAVALRRPRS
jgi:hypothetical protein